MIISGYKKDDEKDEAPQKTWTVTREDRTGTQQVRDLLEHDEILREMVRKHQPITDADVLAAQERVNEDFRIKTGGDREKKLKQQQELDLTSWDFLEQLEKDPLYKRHGRDRSQKATKILLQNIKPSSGYLVPGQIAVFLYEDPATQEQLEWWDRTPCTIFFGYVKNKEGLVRELGFNLHYYPPFIRKKIMQRIFLMFKEYFLQNFDNPSSAKLTGISYQRILNALKNAKMDFGVKEYIPGLRKATRIVPTKYLPTACLTEGNFSGATMQQIHNHWKTFHG